MSEQLVDPLVFEQVDERSQRKAEDEDACDDHLSPGKSLDFDLKGRKVPVSTLT